MPQTGSVLQERYQLKEQLSDNPARETWLAEDLSSEKPVVVKLLVWGGSNAWENLKLFEREAKVLENLDHPRIPRYRDRFALEDDKLWSGLVHDYIPGASLMQLLDEGKKFTEAEVCDIAIATLDILQYLHELNPPVLHRDIKPSNLIFGEDEEIYLVDFGAVQDKAAVARRSFTVVGTYGYTPLEQFGGQAVPASDLYALGATLVHLLTGTPPAELLQKNLHLDFRDRVSTNLNPYFLDWLETLVQPQLDDRFPSARVAIGALNSATALSTETDSISQPDLTPIHLKKTPQTLLISIPEPGLKIRQSASQLLQRGAIAIQSAFASLKDSLSASDLAAQLLIYILIGIGAISVLSLLLQVAIVILPLLILPIAIACLSDYFERTTVFLDRARNTFEIENKRLGFTYRRQLGVTNQIQDVSIYYDNKKFVMGVAITAGHKPEYYQQYSFGSSGRNLTESECIWLAREIHDWLQL
jgi:serine/threonine protein kinase